MRVVVLSAKQFDDFARLHKYKSYYQSSNYGSLMTKFGYETQYLGIISDTEKLIGASLIVYKQVFLSYKKAYAPRGILINYENKEVLEEAILKIKNLLGKQGFISLKMNPYVPLTIRDPKGNIMNFNNYGTKIIDNLKSVGFEYNGKTKKFEDELPRWEALVILNGSPEEMFSKFEKRTRNKIRRAVNFGIEAVKDEKLNVDKLYEFVKGQTNKPKKYYQYLCEYFKDNVELYYARINTETYALNSTKLYEKEAENNNQLQNLIQDQSLDMKQKENIINRKIESDRLLDTYKKALIHSRKLLEQYPKGLTIGAALVIIYGNAAYIVEEGVDPNYRGQNSDYVIKWQMIVDYKKKGFKYISLNGVIGEFDNKLVQNPINEKRLGFNTTVSEYIGEFSIILNKFNYNIYRSFKKK